MNASLQSPPTARLLIIDDEPAHMTALYHTLEDTGYGDTSARGATNT